MKLMSQQVASFQFHQLLIFALLQQLVVMLQLGALILKQQSKMRLIKPLVLSVHI